ncbi:MAG: (2Fe-2S)-binding protein, partial [Thermodesulfobacteriota bacterium]
VKKRIVCRCHDITEADLVRVIREGCDHLEVLKRYTGVLTGPCQGKMCAAGVVGVFVRETGRPVETLSLPTLRPPAEPVPLGWLATGLAKDDDAD